MTARSRRESWWFKLRTSYLTLLVLILLMICLAPLFGPGRPAEILFAVIFFCILISAVLTLTGRRWFLYAGWGLLILSGIGSALLFNAPNPLFALLRVVPAVLFFSIVIVSILSHVLGSDDVTGDRILGAVCVYLLLGIGWASVYSTLEQLHPGSFRLPPDLGGALSIGSVRSLNVFHYYSFVTLSTLGFGDITPATGVARMISVLEAMTGQIYLAVIIAALVGIHIGGRRDGDSAGPGRT